VNRGLSLPPQKKEKKRRRQLWEKNSELSKELLSLRAPGKNTLAPTRKKEFMSLLEKGRRREKGRKITHGSPGKACYYWYGVDYISEVLDKTDKGKRAEKSAPAWRHKDCLLYCEGGEGREPEESRLAPAREKPTNSCLCLEKKGFRKKKKTLLCPRRSCAARRKKRKECPHLKGGPQTRKFRSRKKTLSLHTSEERKQKNSKEKKPSEKGACRRHYNHRWEKRRERNRLCRS